MSQTQPAEHTGSVSSQDPARDDHKKTKSRRPPNTAFRQQRLKAWQPILTPKTVLPLFFFVGIIFAPIGGLLLYASAQVSAATGHAGKPTAESFPQVQELAINYTDCIRNAPETRATYDIDEKLADVPDNHVKATFNKPMTTKPQWGHAQDNYTWPMSGLSRLADVCVLTFTIPNQIDPPILFYYRLTNFYQNHRRYVKSVDIDQLKGKAKSRSDIASGDCSPLDVDASGKPYYPCGLIANSMFNDTFDNLTILNQPGADEGRDGTQFYNFTTKGIAWTSEGDLYRKSAYNASDVAVPPFWQEQWPANGYEDTGLPDLHTWETFQVWMRTAGLPTFSKLAQRNDDKPMQVATYRLKIYDHFPVEKYKGTKSILISTSTVMGGKNPFLGIAYLVVGGLCFLLGVVFLATHLIKPRKLGDHTYLTWNNDQPSTATTTGRAGGA
ncbi:alkylphosphocholine resistance protein lem3 [Pleosporales sp. CAS-2024a]